MGAPTIEAPQATLINRLALALVPLPDLGRDTPRMRLFFKPLLSKRRRTRRRETGRLQICLHCNAPVA